MGRRAIYKTVEEKVGARRQQNRKHVRAFRARKAVEIAQTKWRLPSETSLPEGPARPVQWHIDEYELRAEYPTEVAGRPESKAVELSGRKWRLPPDSLVREGPARPLDWQVDEAEFRSECVTETVERPESRAVVCSSTAHEVTPSPPPVFEAYASPRDTPVDYTISLMNGLFEDFLARANFDSRDQPRVQALQYSRLVNPHPTLALCAIMVGWSRGDRSLIRLASESYQHALRFVRQHTADVHLKSSALALVIATGDLCKYELAILFRNSHVTMSSSAAWSRHVDAGRTIMEYAGPQSFTSKLARQTVLASVKSIAARAFGQRTSTFMASPEWCTYLDDLPRCAYIDRLWLVVLKIPGLMQQVDMLAERQSNVSEVLILLDQLDMVDRSLDSWLDAYNPDEAEDSYSYWASTTPPRLFQVGVSPPIEFNTISEGEVMMTYWAYKLEVSMLREEIEALQVTTIDCHSLPRSSRTSSHRFASLIGRSMAYWIKNVSTDVCLFRLLYAVRVAWDWFSRYPKLYALELRACRMFRTEMKSEPKTGMAEFVMDLFYKPPPEEAP